jgi:hypothetical protein
MHRYPSHGAHIVLVLVLFVIVIGKGPRSRPLRLVLVLVLFVVLMVIGKGPLRHLCRILLAQSACIEVFAATPPEVL